MRANTRIFGEIDIAEDKIITMETGMIGLPNMKKFTLIYDEEKGVDNTSIMYFQSMDDPDTAFPVMTPYQLKPDYQLTVNDEILAPLGELTPENTFVLVTVTVPQKIEDLAINLKAPIIINMDNNRAAQLIVENDYPIKFKIYDLVKESSERTGE